MLAPLGLCLSQTKIRVCHIDEGFDFLGWHIQRRRKRGTTKKYVFNYPSYFRHGCPNGHFRMILSDLYDAGLVDTP